MHAFQATIPFEEGTHKPSGGDEALAEVTLSRDDGQRNRTTTVTGPFPLAMDGFRWHFYSNQRERFVSVCKHQPRQSVEIVGVTTEDRRLRGYVSQVAVGYDGVTIYVRPPQ